jgi:hypothetical protein
LTGRPSIPEAAVIEPRSRGVLDRPVKPDDDSFESTMHLGCLKFEFVTLPSSSPASIPEAAVMESRGRGVLDRPVKPGDDSLKEARG